MAAISRWPLPLEQSPPEDMTQQQKRNHGARSTPAAARRTRIMIADDHPIVRRGLRDTLASEQGFDVVAEAGTADEVLALAAQIPCDVLVLDLSMPGASGLNLLRQCRQQFPSIPVLILSVAPEDQFALRALEAGAAGYLTKRSAPDLLVDAIRRVASGGVHLSLAAGRALVAQALRPPARERLAHGGLSTRELQILHLLASGLTPTRIGRELDISVKTVSTHRRRLLEKLHLDSTAALIGYALQHGLLEY